MFRISITLVIAGVFAIAVASQSQKPAASRVPQKQDSSIQSAQKQIEELKTEVASLQASAAAMRATEVNLLGRVTTLELQKHDSVTLDLTSRAYQRLDTDMGTFLVSVQDVTSYLDGYRITLDIGNPSYATYKGFQVHTKWNTAYDWGKFEEASFQTWQKQTRERDDSFPDSLDPGKWNRVQVLLPSTTGAQLGYFEISMTTNTVSLYTGN